MFLASELYLSSSTGNDFDIRLFSKKKKKKFCCFGDPCWDDYKLIACHWLEGLPEYGSINKTFRLYDYTGF